MAEKKEKIVGILGGMGPDATVDLMQRIIRLTPALDDADHIRCIVDNNPKVPSRIKAIIEGGGEDPGPCMADMGRRLASWGADFLVIACNTAHYYHGAVQQAVDIPVINLIDLVTNHVKDHFPDTGVAGGGHDGALYRALQDVGNDGYMAGCRSSGMSFKCYKRDKKRQHGTRRACRLCRRV